MVMYRDPLVHLRESLEEARGLCDAGKFGEALRALDGIPPRYQVNPDILEFRCHLYMSAKQWALAADLAQRLAETEPVRRYPLRLPGIFDVSPSIPRRFRETPRNG